MGTTHGANDDPVRRKDGGAHREPHGRGEPRRGLDQPPPEEHPQEHPGGEGRDRPPNRPGRDPKSPWLGGG